MDLCIDIVNIWFRIANGQILSIFDRVIRLQNGFSFPDDNFSKYQWICSKLAMCIDIIEVCFGNANGQFLSTFDRVICP